MQKNPEGSAEVKVNGILWKLQVRVIMYWGIEVGQILFLIEDLKTAGNGNSENASIS